MKISRALLPAALAGALLITGCSAGGGAVSKDAAGKECLAPGDASKSLEVSGKVGEDAKIDSKTPLKATKLERSVLKKGEGDVAKEGQKLNVSMAMFNGKDGASLQQAPASEVPLAKDQLAAWAYEGLRCAQPGEEVAVVGSFTEVLGEAADPTQLGVEGLSKKDSIVVVMKIGKIADAPKILDKAEGKAKAAPKGFPEVKLAKDGAPTITIPKDVKPPSKLEVATLIEGDGETVEPGDTVTVNYRGVIWSTGEEFDSSWSRGTPAEFPTNGVIGGFQKALEGQKVGSQVISVVPAEDGGYGAAKLEEMGHKPDDVMVFVLDILGTVHAAK